MADTQYPWWQTLLSVGAGAVISQATEALKQVFSLRRERETRRSAALVRQIEKQREHVVQIQELTASAMRSYMFIINRPIGSVSSEMATEIEAEHKLYRDMLFRLGPLISRVADDPVSRSARGLLQSLSSADVWLGKKKPSEVIVDVYDHFNEMNRQCVTYNNSLNTRELEITE